MKFIAFVILCFSCAAFASPRPNSVGDIPYDYVGKGVDGSEVHISAYKGKVVIISFWATWCTPCMKELPVLSGIQKQATPEQLQVVSINYGEPRKTFKKIAKALSENQMKLVSDYNKKTGKKYGVGGIPHMVIVDRQGKVAAVHIGYNEGKLLELVREINEISQR